MKTTAKILISSLLACMILLVSCGDPTPYAILRAHIRENGTEDGEVCIFENPITDADFSMVVDKAGHIYWHYNAAGFDWIIEFNEGENLHPVTIIGEDYESTAKIDAAESREGAIVFSEFTTDAPALVAGTIGGLFEITAGSIFLMAEYMLPTEVDFADLGFVNYYNK